MRKHAIRGILCLAIILLPGFDLMAFTFEAHPGLYTSYEYSDNYQGVSQDKQSESTYLCRTEPEFKVPVSFSNL